MAHFSFPGSAWERKSARLCLAVDMLKKAVEGALLLARRSLADGVPRQSLGTR
jgi:hypothetical protein